MRQLRGIDGSFLRMETLTLPMHTLKVLVFSGPSPTQDEVGAHAGEWLARVPVLRERLVDLPWGLGQPFLIEDLDFDLARHVRRVRLPAPASDAALDDLVSEIAGGALRRDRALWELVIVDGLAGDRWGAVIKLHHTLADGAAAVAMLSSLLDGPPTVAAPEAPPPFLARLALGLRSLGRTAVAVPPLVGHTARTARAIRERRRRGGIRPSGVFEAPRLSLNGEVSAARRFVRTALPLARFGAIQKKTGATLNDAWLAVVAGAMRSYLQRRAELPDRALVASIPVGGGHAHVAGNDLTSLFAALPTHVTDPLARLASVRESTQAAKEELALIAALERAWIEALPPFLFGRIMNAPASLGLSQRRPPVNLVISSVRGPQEPLFVEGRELESIHSVGPLVANVGLNITAWSYREQFFCGLLACARAAPDLQALADALETALFELEAAEAPPPSEAQPPRVPS